MPWCSQLHDRSERSSRSDLRARVEGQESSLGGVEFVSIVERMPAAGDRRGMVSRRVCNTFAIGMPCPIVDVRRHEHGTQGESVTQKLLPAPYYNCSAYRHMRARELCTVVNFQRSCLPRQPMPCHQSFAHDAHAHIEILYICSCIL